MFNWFKKELEVSDPKHKSYPLHAQIGDTVDGEEVINVKPCQDEVGIWKKMTTKTPKEEIKVYEVYKQDGRTIKKLHNESN